ncbi:EAL domain-containing protein [Veronia pacifica]|uniref:EAL domain-containing protein n=1 Tax=Veronia pacifica TaxID=1080227 RepID=A0A1C3EKU2_9GAMM|nr:EAL domain-containing protein [Veronia pacifica]ODA33852.1 hypothetical protein A8L45_08470 [Veronia pacifica]
MTTKNVTALSDSKTTNASLTFCLQPIIDIKTLRTHALELLTRVHSNSGEHIHSEPFFSNLNEESLKTIIKDQITALNEQAKIYTSTSLIISINIPLKYFIDFSFMGEVVNMARFPLAIEVTDVESFKGEHIQFWDSTSLLKQNGHQIWFDDYLPTPINDEVLELIRWDMVKIDQSFLYQHIDEHDVIADLIDKVNFHCNDIVLEGVETSYMHCELKRFGTYVQGFYYAHPRDMDMSFTNYVLRG